MSDLLSLFFRSHTLIPLTTPVISSCYLFSFSARFCCQVCLGGCGEGGGTLDGGQSEQRNAENTFLLSLNDRYKVQVGMWSLILLENSSFWLNLFSSQTERTPAEPGLTHNTHTHTYTHLKMDFGWTNCCCWLKDLLHLPKPNLPPLLQNEFNIHLVPPSPTSLHPSHTLSTSLFLYFQTELSTNTSISSPLHSSFLFFISLTPSSPRRPVRLDVVIDPSGWNLKPVLFFFKTSFFYGF